MNLNRIIIYFIIVFNLLFPRSFDVKDIPVQENGRIKPLDTFARNHLLAMYGKRTLKSSALPDDVKVKKLSAVDWLIDIAMHPNDADVYEVFNIKNPEIVGSLGLIWNSDHMYNRMDILMGLQHQLEYIKKIQSMEQETLDHFDEGMLNLYKNVIHFQELCFSLTCLLPLISIEDQNIATTLKIDVGKKISYYDVMNNAEALNPFIEKMISKKQDDWNGTDRKLSNMLMQLNELNKDNFSQALKIIPSDEKDFESNWLSPWELMDGRKIGQFQQKMLNVLSNYVKANLNDNEIEKNNVLLEYEKLLMENNAFNINHLKTETWYNELDIFIKSMVLYILSFFLLSISFMYRPVFLRKVAFISLLIGLIVHFYGILLRIIIMQRPPVTTLYESVLFVSLIGVICSVFLEYNRKDGMGIFAGSICGVILHFVGFGYANDGDTLGMLVAVLNSNFWLSTHVITITTGYGTSLFAGLLGHVYLIQAIKNPNNHKYLKTINSNMFGATLFALFFTLFGTILGGIWADQSWGRFWGWDPKENGALLIVMWQIIMLHMRITGHVKPLGFAFGMIINNIVVIMAWFGVNLLSVGLHSYGFASGIAMNITLFVLFELLFGIGAFCWAKSMKKNFTTI